MKASKFNITNLKKTADRYYGYNTLTGSLIRIAEENKETVRSILERPDSFDDNNPFKKTLLSEGFLIDSGIDEWRHLRLAYDLARNNRTRFSLTILPTQKCNFCCPYCYETTPNHTFMAQETQSAVLRWIASATLHQVGEVSLVWYGGEPLLALDIVVNLQQRIQEYCESKNISLQSHMVTNGYLLQPVVARQLSEAGIEDFQITLDGPQRIHDNRRYLIGGQPTYDTILKNIEFLVDAIPGQRIALRTNLDKNNIDYYLELIEELEKRGLTGKVVLNPSEVNDVNECVVDKKTLFERDDFHRKMFQIKMGLRKKGWLISAPLELSIFKGNHCGADNFFTIVISADGKLYKCWNDVGIPGKDLGTLDTPLIAVNGKNEYLFDHPFQDDRCMNCVFLPACMGSCPYERLMRKKDFPRIHCSAVRSNFERLITYLVKSPEEETENLRKSYVVRGAP